MIDNVWLESGGGHLIIMSIWLLLLISLFAARMPKYALALLPLWFLAYQLPNYGDFTAIFYPQLSAAYPLSGVFNPPWSFVPLYPLQVLSNHAAGALWVAISILIMIYAVSHWHGDPLTYLLVFTNPFIFALIVQPNLDALVLLGLIVEKRRLTCCS